MITIDTRVRYALALLLLLPIVDIGAQPSSLAHWYGRLGYSLARLDGGDWATRGLEGFEVAVGRSIGEARRVGGAIELQGESLNKRADDLTCPPRIGTGRCTPEPPDLFLVTASAGVVVQRSIWRVGGFAGPTLISAGTAGRHGGVSLRLQLAALLHPNFAIAAGTGTTRLSSLQSTTLWIPRADVSLRLSLP